MKNKTDQLFINMLLKDTYEFMPEEDLTQSSQGLEEYFHQCENKIEHQTEDIFLLNFLEKNCHRIYKVKYNYKTSCFNISFDSGELDIPKTWGEFKSLEISLTKKKNLFCELVCEETSLTDIFSSIEKNMIKLRHYFLINYNSEYCLVSVDTVEKTHFSSWIAKYLRIEEEESFSFSDVA